MNQDREFETRVTPHQTQPKRAPYSADFPRGSRQRFQSSISTIDLIGREAEQAALLAHLHSADRRLVTVVGPGGIGKTSLALHVAASVAGEEESTFTDGVAVVLLAAVGNVDDVPLAIGDGLGYTFQGERPIVEQLLDALSTRRLLLLLDNVEHLLTLDDGAALTGLLLRLLTEAPAVQLLITSRERLRMREEWVLELAGLSVPATDQGPHVEQADAVRLFVERAQRVVPTFTLATEHYAALTRICQRLEGMPLALELAASWGRALSLAEIATEVDRALNFLTLTNRDVPARHRSMRAALDHSWDLLYGDERYTLARLSVFRGGCDRDAAMSITGATLLTITALIDKSLLHAEIVDNVTRYRLHELVRQYAAERLAENPADERTTEDRHTLHFASLLQHSLDPRTGASTPEARRTLFRNIDNLRAAWMRAIERGNIATLGIMVRGFWILYDDHGWLHDAVTLFGQAAAALRGQGGEATAVFGHILGLYGYFLMRVARFAQALPVLEEALAVLRAENVQSELAIVLNYMGMNDYYLARPIDARQHLDQAATMAAAHGDHFLYAWCEIWLGVIALHLGDYKTAEVHMRKFLATVSGQGYSRGEATGLAALAEVLRHLGRTDEASAIVQQGLQIASETRDSLTLSMCLNQFGALALAHGEVEEARSVLEEGASLVRALGDPWHTARTLFHLVQAQLASGDIAIACETCAELAHIALEKIPVMLGEALYSHALLQTYTGNYVDAWALLDVLDSRVENAVISHVAERLRTDISLHLTSAERTTATQSAHSHDLSRWLDELANRTPAPATATRAPSKTDTEGAAHVAVTGETLSPRELEVVRLLASGASNAIIAQELVISLHTAKTHVAHILAKLNVATRTEAALKARELGLA